MFNRFGLKFRSAAIFVTSDLSSAARYAHTPQHVSRIVPLGDYRFCWSPLVADMLCIPEFLYFESEQKLFSALDRFQYQCDDLSSANQSGNEVMLSCEHYIGMPIASLGISPSLRGSLIIPQES
jgi:hypothetical protein